MVIAREVSGASDGAVTAFSHAGASIVVEETGSGERTFVLVHGIGMGRSVFAGLARILRHHGRVIAVDLPGYGEAPEPERTLTMQRTADLLAAFLRYRNPQGVVLVGHSMGTQVVAEVAARHPGLAVGVVLCGPTVDLRARTPHQQLARLAHDLAIESPVVVARGLREYLRAGPNLRRKLHAMLAHFPEDAYGRIGVPVLVVRGAEDRVAPRSWCEIVLSLLPDAHLVEVSGHGHETMIRDPRPAAEHILGFTDAL